MSIVVLTSRGQDPAEFENHFSRGLKLPKNAEICLCGAQLTRADPTEGQTIAGGNNDGFIIVYGGAGYGAYAPYGSYRIKIKPGIFTPVQLASQIINALAVGNYNKDFAFGNFSDIPVSPLRLGLFCSYDATNEKMKFSCDRNYVNATKELDPDFIGKKFVVSCGQDLGGSPGTIPGNVSDPLALTLAQLDRRYCAFYPSETANCLLKTDVLWNGSMGGAPLQPTDPAVAVFGNSTPDDIIPNYQYGWRWGVQLDETVDREYILGMCGGIIQSRKVWNETTHTGYDIRDEAANQHDLRLDWAVGGAKWDLWWEVERFVPAQGAPGSYQIGVYYHPIPKAWTGNEVWDRSNAVKVGEGRWGVGPGGTPVYNEVVFRPVDGKLGDAATAYKVGNAADENKCCIDFLTNTVDPQALAAGPVNGAARHMTASGAPGYVAVSDEGQFDLYTHAPIYMGYAHRNNVYLPPDPSQLGAICLQGIEHAAKTNEIASMSQIPYAEWVDDPANVSNPNFSFLPITFAFSPLTENINSFSRPMIQAASQRYSNIAGSIGFQERKTHTLASSASTTGLSSDFAAANWAAPCPLAIIQLPNIGIDGDLGGGNSVWGGAISANILGVVPTVETSDATRREVFHEPANENWIKVKNLGSDSLDQIKVKITDNTGKKLTGLTPDSSIWIKIKCGSDGKNMTLEKRGAVFPNERAPTAIDSAYRNY